MTDLVFKLTLIGQESVSKASQAVVGGLKMVIQSTTSLQKVQKQLGTNKTDLVKLTGLQSNLVKTGISLDRAQKKTLSLGLQMRQTTKPSEKLAAAFSKNAVRVSNLRQAIVAKNRALEKTQKRLRAAGLATKKLFRLNNRLVGQEKRLTTMIGKRGRATAWAGRTRNRLQPRKQLDANMISVGSAMKGAGQRGLGLMGGLIGSAMNAQQSGKAAAAVKQMQDSFEDLRITLGSTLLPILTDFSEKMSKLAIGLTKWSKENPGLTKGLLLVVAGLSVLLLVVGPIIMLLGGLVGGWALLTFSLASSSRSMTILRPQINKLTASLTGMASRALPMAITGIRILGAGIRILGLALLTNPIGLIITGIALAAGLLIMFWKPISGFFERLWGGVTDTVGAAWGFLKQLFSWTPLGMLARSFGGLAKVFSAPLKSAWNVVRSYGGKITGTLSGAGNVVKGMLRKVGIGGDKKTDDKAAETGPGDYKKTGGKTGGGLFRIPLFDGDKKAGDKAAVAGLATAGLVMAPGAMALPQAAPNVPVVLAPSAATLNAPGKAVPPPVQAGPVSININGADKSPREIADEVARVMAQDRREALFDE